MFSSNECSFEKCSYLSRALCNCCEKYLCLEHLKIHSDQLNDELIPITDQFNKLNDELNNISFNDTLFIKQLNNWSYQAHQSIDKFYQNKLKEFEIYFNFKKEKEKIEFSNIKNKFQLIINKQEATKENIQLLNNILKSIDKQINLIKNENIILIPLIIDDKICSINSNKYLSLSLPYKTIIRKEITSDSIAANDQNILICQSSKLCLLNYNMEIDKQIPWLYGNIYDMFFSKLLQQFIILTNKFRFNLDQKTMNFTKYSINDNNIIQNSFFAGTSFNQYLFLTTNFIGTSIYQYKIFPFIELFKEWKSPISCQLDEFIDDIRSNHSYLAIIISNKIKNLSFFQLLCPITFEKQWIFNISLLSLEYRIRCSPIENNQWLITNPTNSSLLYIDQYGKMIKEDKYNSSPYHTIQLNNNKIIISTKNHFNLHQLFY